MFRPLLRWREIKAFAKVFVQATFVEQYLIEIYICAMMKSH